MDQDEIAKGEAERAAKELGDQNEAKGLNRDGTPKAPSQNGRSEKEKAEFALKKNAERLAELGGDPADVLNIRPTISIDSELTDDTPLTVGTFRQIQKEDAHKTALQLADELPEDERDEVKDLLQHRIVPSGNAEEDLRVARVLANGAHNAQVIDHISKRTAPKQTAAGGTQVAPSVPEFVPTPDEAALMKPPFNVTKEQILAKRPK